MNPAFARGEPLAEPFERIMLALNEFSRAHLVVVIADDETLRREAIAELGARLSGRCLLRAFDFTQPPMPSLPRFCRTLARQHPFCVVAYGLEKLREKAEQEDQEGEPEAAEQARRTYNEALAFLNMHREDIGLSKATVVLWVTTAVYADLRSQAGDFWAWHTAEVRFEPPPEVGVRPTTLGQLPLEDAEDLRRQARSIEDILARPHHPNPALVADLQRQLGEIHAHLGHQQESTDLQEQAIATLIELDDEPRLKELYCQRLIAANEYLDFRGILQVREVLRLRLEDLYVPLWAITEATQRVLTRRAGAGRNPSRDREGAEQEAETTQLVEARGFEARRASKPPRQEQTDEQLLDNLLHVERTLEKRVEIAKALREHQRLVVLGDPGTGKSTLLKLLALTFARGRSFVRKKLDLDEDRLPLLIPIAAYGEAVAANMNLSFVDFLLHRLAQDGLPDHRLVHAALDQGECLLLVYGLDEVLDLNIRLHVSRQIERFLNTCDSRNRVVVTSRIAGYQRVGFSGDFAHLTLLPFGEEEITAFVRHWTEAYERQTNPHDHERRAAQRARVLTDAILSVPAIRSLAANPLLVTILALIHQQGTRLPHQRVELYRLCVEALAEHWQRARSLYKPIDMYLGPRRLDEPYVVGMLAPIAFTLFKTKPTGLLHRTDLERQIAERLIEYEEVGKADAPSLARQFVELMREQSGLLIERGAASSISFIRRSRNTWPRALLPSGANRSN